MFLNHVGAYLQELEEFKTSFIIINKTAGTISILNITFVAVTVIVPIFLSKS